jgi:hypothetical protein
LPGLNANSQMTGMGFWGKRNKAYYSSDEDEDSKSQPLTAMLPTSKRKCLLFNGEFRKWAWLYDEIYSGLGSPGVWYHTSKALS